MILEFYKTEIREHQEGFIKWTDDHVNLSRFSQMAYMDILVSVILFAMSLIRMVGSINWQITFTSSPYWSANYSTQEKLEF